MEQPSSYLPLLVVSAILQQEHGCLGHLPQNGHIEQARFFSVHALNVRSVLDHLLSNGELLRPQSQAQRSLIVPVLKVKVQTNLQLPRATSGYKTK